MCEALQTLWTKIGLALSLTVALCPALGGLASAQESVPERRGLHRDVYVTDVRPYYVSGRCQGPCGGPYKGFYPCNCATPYCGGGCNVYGDAPVYSAPADFGSHCALWCR